MRQLLPKRSTNWQFERNVKYFLHSLILLFCFCGKNMRRDSKGRRNPQLVNSSLLVYLAGIRSMKIVTPIMVIFSLNFFV